MFKSPNPPLLANVFLKLHTSFGNHAFLGIDSRTSSRYLADSCFTLQPPDGAVISGFSAKLGAGLCLHDHVHPSSCQS